MERPRRVSTQHAGSDDPGKGDPLFQSYPCGHGPVQAHSETPARSCGAAEKLPDNLRKTPDAQLLSTAADRKVYNVIQLIYRAKDYEGHSKDYEFSRLSMEEHWRAGYHDARRTLRHPDVLKRPENHEGFFTFDLAVDGRE